MTGDGDAGADALCPRSGSCFHHVGAARRAWPNMRGYFGFECLGIGGADRSLVVFCSSRAPNEVDLREQISTFCDNNKVPDAIFVVSPQSVTGDLKQACAALESKLASATRYRNPPALYVVTFDDLGSLQPMPGTVIPPHIDRRRMIRQGMTDIFFGATACFRVIDTTIFASLPVSTRITSCAPGACSWTAPKWTFSASRCSRQSRRNACRSIRTREQSTP